jgi:hypothetical protein
MVGCDCAGQLACVHGLCTRHCGHAHTCLACCNQHAGGCEAIRSLHVVLKKPSQPQIGQHGLFEFGLIVGAPRTGGV